MLSAQNASKTLTRATNNKQSQREGETSPNHPELDIFDVEQLVFHRIIESPEETRIEYLVQWAGDWPPEQRYTSEPEDNIVGPRLLGDYWRGLLQSMTVSELA